MNERSFEKYCISSNCLLISERKLAKIKGINGQSSKDMVTAFEKKKDDLMYKFINSVHDLNQYDTDSIEKNNAENSQIYSLIERKIFPEKHAISNEELQKLIEADLLNKIFQDMNKEHDQDK